MVTQNILTYLDIGNSTYHTNFTSPRFLLNNSKGLSQEEKASQTVVKIIVVFETNDPEAPI